MPLKGIPCVLSPDILHALCAAGHGDQIVLADSNYPSESISRTGPKLIRADGIKIPLLLEAILKLYPLDTYIPKPVALMEVVQSDKEKGFGEPPVWQTYKDIIYAAEKMDIGVELVDRFEFYERSRKAFAIIHTGETAQYGNIILTKGVVLSK